MSEFLTDQFWQGEYPKVMETPQVGAPPACSSLPPGRVLFSSSGSSGRAKWIVHTRDSLRASALAVNAHLKVGPKEVFGLCLPVYHVGGFGLLARAYWAGARCCTYEGRWDARRACQWIEQQSVSLLSLVATQLHDLVATQQPAPASLRAVVIGGGALEASLGQSAQALGWPILASYGMTEAGSQIATDSLDSLSAAYRPRPLPLLPGWQVRFEDDDQLAISGDALAWGQITRDGTNPWKVEPFEKWHQTQDRATWKEGGLFYLGRRDRTVKVRGELVDLAFYENALQTRLGVEVVLLTGRPVRAGAELLAVCEQEALPNLTKAQLNLLLPAYAPVERLLRVPRFPRSGLQKIDRRALRAQIDKIRFPDC